MATAALTRTPETASAHLVTRLPLARPGDGVGTILARLPGSGCELVDTVYVVDEAHRLVGLAPLARLLAAAAPVAIETVMSRRFPAVGPNTDQEHVALAALEHAITAVPVTDVDGRLLGAVSPHALVSILYQEHAEDLHRLAGIRRELTRATDAIEAPPSRQARDRLPWLLVGLAGSMVATIVMSRFEAALRAQVAIAFFVPGIVYLADAMGTQAEAVAVRGLSLSRASLRHLLWDEIGTGVLIGLVLAAVSYPAVLLGFGDGGLALAVAVALVAAGTVATSIGLLLPWILARLGTDPAFGSGPLATVIQDVLSLLIYLTAATAMVR
jgi:magnesium transporter